INYSVSVTPSLPHGFALESETGAIVHDGTGLLNTSFHNLTFTAGEDEVVIPVSITVKESLPYPYRVRSHLGGLSLLDDYSSGGVMSISSTKDHVCINQKSGGIHCWGDGLGGKLATNADTDQSTPQSTSTSVSYNVLRDIYSVATATEHNCALTNSREVYCWGEADDGRLGHSSTTDSKIPVLAPFPNHRNVEMIATHESHNCAITDDGSVYCWGNNTDGQIGIGYKSSYFGNPTKSNLQDGSMAVAISVGDSFSCAVLSNGSVTCWGGNDLGQLGDGTNTNSTAPGSMVQLSQDAVTVSSGQSHSCAILQDGKVACWGNNDYGQLGDGTLIDKNSPAIAQLPSSKSAVMIDVGISHTCAIMNDGTLYCWGLNANHQLADGTNAFKSIPVQSSLPNGMSATLVTAGEGHTCILTNESTIYCIGANSEGQIGDSTTASRTIFTETQWNQNNSIPSLYYTLGYATENKLSFTGWGDEYNVTSTPLPAGLTLDSEKGTLTYNGMSTFSDTITIFVTDGNVNFSKNITIQVFEHNQIEGRIDSYSYDSGFGTFSQKPISVRMGYHHGCLIDYDHKMKCWGYNGHGEIGISYTGSQYTYPTNINHGYMTSSRDMDVGTYQVCSIDNESKLWCWGYNPYGNLGVGDATVRNTPSQVKDITNTLQVSVGQYLACALDSSWDVYCWGYNNQGQAGESSLSNQLRPNLISGLGDSRPTMVSAGDSLACALIENGSVACWGANNLGQLGIGSTVQSYEQIQWPNLPQGLSASSISVGSNHACAIMDDYSLYCWGQNNYGQVGVGNTTDILTPTQILDSSYEVVGVTTGVSSTCSWLRNGSALCWGYNPYGNLGNGNATQMDEPAWVRPHSLNTDMKIITMHNTLYNTCAMYDNGAISCWGQGQTYWGNGDGSAGNQNYPQSFVYNQYTGQRYDGSGNVVSNLNYLEGYPREEKLQNIGWNSNSSVSGVLPNGLSYNSSSEILSYDGSTLTPGNFNIQITDDFGSRNLQVSYSSVHTNSKEGRIDSAWLGNASFNSMQNKDYQQIISIDNSEQHTCILELDGDVLCWGLGTSYQLGTGSTTSYNYPYETNVDSYYPNLNFSSISTGDLHTCALDSDSELLCWGSRAQYRLGDNSASGTQNYPYKYTGDSEVYDKKLAMVSSGGEHTCAIRADATTWCWGLGNYGQTGDGSINMGTQPKQVQFPNNLSATSLSLGYSSTCAIVDTDEIYCWGRNHAGQLGIGNTTDQSLPIKVLLPSGRTALAIESGDYHTCAILDDYSVKCWGQNTNGQIGDGTTDDRSSPASVILSGVNNPIQLSAGQSSTCAVFDNGRIKCWGLNSNGELGTGNQNQQNSPQDLNSISHLHASHVTVGNAFACATFHDGAPRCWGSGGSGKLGTGTTSSSNVPVSIREYASENITIIEGSEISIPLTVAGWDYTTSASGTYPTGVTWDNVTESIVIDSDLQVGNYTISVAVSNSVKSVTASIELKVIDRIDRWSDRVESHSLGMSVLSEDDSIPVDLSIGRLYSCFITDSSNYCQGYNTNGQLGENSYSQRNTPYEIYGFDEPLTSISTGNEHTCGINENGELYCWGLNSYGQIGNGYNHYTYKYNSPQKISIDYSSNQLPPALQISTGYQHSCGIFEDSNLYCWGYNGQGQLGLGDTTLRNRPMIVQTPGDDLFTDISLGYSHSCSIIKNGSVYCWGYNNYGQLGDSTNDYSNIPVYSQLPSGSKAVAISAGDYHNCAIMDNSSVYCWGYNQRSQLGNGNQTNMNIPVHVNIPIGSNPVQISSSDSHTCTVMDNGSMYCWGHNDYRQVEGLITENLGNYVYNPTYVSTKFNHRVVSVDVGEGFTCTITEYAAISCWGSTSNGKLVELNENKVSKLRYVISEEYEYSIQPMGWNIQDYSINNQPQGMTMNESKLLINSEANQTGSLSWIVNTTLGTTQGTIDYEAMLIDRRPSSAPAWTNSIFYKEEDSAVSLTSVDAWYSHACGIDEEGKVYCWGANDDGQLGDLSTNRRSSPNPVRFSGEDPVAIQVSTSRYNTCILTDEGRVMCWGDGTQGQNGQGTWDASAFRYDLKTPGEVLLPWSSNAVMISTGRQFACSLLDDGTVYCWGDNLDGQLGDGSVTDSGLPRKVQLPSDRFAISIDSGTAHSCAVLDNGEMYCWGKQNYANMGTGVGITSTTNNKIKIPIKVEIPQSKSVSFMGVGEYHGCAVMTDNTLWCWGHNSHGEVGVGNSSSSNSEIIRKPIQIDLQFYSPIIAIDLGIESTCTLHDDGSLNCWGENDDGEIGNGLIGGDTSSPIPIQLDGGVMATGITSGYRFKCATASDGTIQCWGYNSESQLGDGTQEPSAYPQVV
ncbi:MAG: RCC1 domain-containing protein, partial [Candidatus Poseidoniales archaeon]